MEKSKTISRVAQESSNEIQIGRYQRPNYRFSIPREGIRVASTSTSRVGMDETRREETRRYATRRAEKTRRRMRLEEANERSDRRGAANKLSATHWATCSSSEVRVWQIKLGVRSGRPLDAAANY